MNYLWQCLEISSGLTVICWTTVGLYELKLGDLTAPF